MDKALRNTLRNVVTQCRKLLEEAIGELLQGHFGVHANGTVEDVVRLTHLSAEDLLYREEVLAHLEHIKASGLKPKDAAAQLIREAAFTHLNRLCAYKMMTSRGLIEDPVGKGLKSRGFLFYLADHPADETLYNGGQQDLSYRHYFDWLNESLSSEIGVLFAREDLATRLFPPYRVLIRALDLINSEELANVWTEDETIGWVYQYFTPKELRDQARRESAAPRNSYELAFRNQFYTPRYVVEFLVDNTLGRLWYEMRKGDTALAERCRYLVRRPNEIVLSPDEEPPENAAEATRHLSQEELLKQPVYIKHREKKDPRDIKILDPACGSGHFLLYCFGLLEVIYEEAYEDKELGPVLRRDYPKPEDLKRELPRLILEHNLHGIDIDLRSTQISALALWLRCQRAYKELGLENGSRPQVRKTNIVCAEPMPGERELLEEFVKGVYPPFLGDVVRAVFERMKLAGEAGSLLKIEREISGAIAEAKKHWRAIPQQQQLALFRKEKLSDGKQGALFDLSGITDQQFWDEAEARVLESLHEYAERIATNGHGLMRRLFADDAAHGFAFVDICRKLFSVVLMNPPFGSSSPVVREYSVKTYADCREDIDAAFVRRGIELLGDSGLLGAIVNRTQLFKLTLRAWREDVLLGRCSFDVAADLGYGVLDTALVEAAAYVLRKRQDANHISCFFRQLRYEDKAKSLGAAVKAQNSGENCQRDTFWIPPLVFYELPGSRISYWASPAVRFAFKKYKAFEGNWGTARQGSVTSDNFRFLRLYWEIPAAAIAQTREQTFEVPKRWTAFAKGGEYSPYFQDLHLVVAWQNDGHEIRNLRGADGGLMSRPQNLQYNFKPAITYSERTASNFSPRLCPPGCVYSQVGPIVAVLDPDLLLPILGILMSRVTAFFIELMVEAADAVTSGSAARHYTQGVIGSIPVPDMIRSKAPKLNELVKGIWRIKSMQDGQEELGRYFVRPKLLQANASLRNRALKSLFEDLVRTEEDRNLEILKHSWELEQITRGLYQLDESSVKEIDDDFGPHPETLSRAPLGFEEERTFSRLYSSSVEEMIDEEVEQAGGSRAVTKKGYFADRMLELLCASFERHPQVIVETRRRLALSPESQLRADVVALLSYKVGCSFGHWDIRYATGGQTPTPENPDPLAAVPVCAPGALMGEDGLPVNKALGGYPMRIGSDSLFVDDSDSEDDIIRRVREVFVLIWNERAEEIEREACEILGVKELRDYFRKPGAGGFWMDHVRRYSKSRRKAPIYWLLRSAKGNYAIWLYYHRLDKDVLYKALLNYVEPKLRLEENSLSQLRQRRETVGTTGREAKQLEKELDKQESFISELHDFHDKLKRAANLHLEPDLNDGVVLNIAPLWELVPWTEAKKYWKELTEGKYEWSSIAKQLRDRGL